MINMSIPIANSSLALGCMASPMWVMADGSVALIGLNVDPAVTLVGAAMTLVG